MILVNLGVLRASGDDHYSRSLYGSRLVTCCVLNSYAYMGDQSSTSLFLTICNLYLHSLQSNSFPYSGSGTLYLLKSAKFYIFHVIVSVKVVAGEGREKTCHFISKEKRVNRLYPTRTFIRKLVPAPEGPMIARHKEE
jgi:hypothetical protein